MAEIYLKNGSGIGDTELLETLQDSVKGEKFKKVLLIPPDFTRMHSYAGKITELYYEMLKGIGVEIDVLPALGTHEPVSEKEWKEFFGNVPFSAKIDHDWRGGVVKIGEVPGEYVAEVSGGIMNQPIDVEVNRILLDNSYDKIISVGQVVPHEVIGMANYSKNIFVGCGGSSMINSSHMLGAFYGMERMMGRDKTPVRKVFDYAEERFIKMMPIMYVLTVTTASQGIVSLHGLFIGRSRSLFEEAVKLSQQKNIIFVDEPLSKVVAYLDEAEFKSTWVGNKAIYRTRMAMADGGELIVIAPGISKFGEDAENDTLIRKYGYIGRENVLRLCGENEDLQGNLSVAAHLIHGSADGRFSVTLAAGKLTQEEIEGANYKYADIGEITKIYAPSKLKDGYNTLPSGETVYYISNPALGLWADKGRFENE